MKETILFSLLFFAIVFIAAYFIYYMIFDDKLKKEKYTKTDFQKSHIPTVVIILYVLRQIPV